MPGDVGTIPEWGRTTGEGKGNALQYSCLENPRDKVAKSRTRLSMHAFNVIVSLTVGKKYFKKSRQLSRFA